MAKKSQGAKAPEREIVRANLRLDAEQYRRLLVFSVMESRSAGDIVSSLLEQHLRGWSMPGLVKPRDKRDQATLELSVNNDGQIELSPAESMRIAG